MPQTKTLELIAYALPGMTLLPLRPAPRSRPWMAATTRGFAHRCLPLRAANESGWLIHTSHALAAEWNGDPDPSAVTLDWGDAPPPYPAVSHFGHGIVTFTLPYLFRTPPGISLWVRGPVNHPKDGIYPLEAIVDTDWAVSTFTMNWKLTCPGVPAAFEPDEPICMVVPPFARAHRDARASHHASRR